jgi:hypothetical protein
MIRKKSRVRGGSYYGSVSSSRCNSAGYSAYKVFFMKVWTTILLFTILTKAYAQVPLGTGIVRIEFDANTIVDFYQRPTDKLFSKRVEFFNDKTIDSWNIKNLENERTWLKPEIIWLDYSQFNFRCISTKGDWLEVIVNNDNGRTYWIKKNNTTKFLTWEEYLKDMYSVSRLDKNQKLRNSPADSAKEIEYKGTDCFQVRTLRGDWIEIFTGDYCDEYGTKNQITSGWIKWRRGDKLLIKYHTIS